MRQETLLFIGDTGRRRILLAMKKVRFGAGKYNGTGGGVEAGETPAQAAVREAQEETGVRVELSDLEPMGTIEFSFEGKPDWSRHVYLFRSSVWSGIPTESDEMKPEWFDFDKIPYEKMWIDDKFWLPKIIDGKKIKAKFHFNNDGSAILHQEIHGS